jgi:hypothetical protein
MKCTHLHSRIYHPNRRDYDHYPERRRYDTYTNAYTNSQHPVVKVNSDTRLVEISCLPLKHITCDSASVLLTPELICLYKQTRTTLPSLKFGGRDIVKLASERE